MSYKILMPILMAACLVGSTAVAGAVKTVNGTKSNTFKTQKDCKAAGGTWTNGRDGLGCYLPVQ